MNLSPEHQALLKHLSNRVRRIQTLYWIEDANGRKVKFRMNWAQREFLSGMWYLNMILKVRQIGMSTFMGILQLDRCLFARNQTCGIVDKTDDDAKKKLSKIEFAYNHLDDPEDQTTCALGAAIKQAVRITVANKRELEWSNGSKIWAGTSLRGGTVNWLHVSELGPIAYKYPEKAKEIAAGSFNTVHRGNIITVESTHEGGRYGLNYELIRRAQGTQDQDRTELDWKFFFFPWWKEPNYQLPLVGPLRLKPEHARHFDTLEKQLGITLTPEQKHWWVKKAMTPKVNMAQQFPGTAEEAMQAVTEGAIYGREIAELRASGRIRSLRQDGNAPVYVFGDLGVSDYLCLWFLQFVGMDIVALDYYSAHGITAAQVAGVLLERERVYGQLKRIFVPHDANNRGLTGKTWVDAMNEAGIRNITVVPRTPDVWIGIQHLRSLLPRFYFNADTCERDFELPSGRLIPSGLGAIEGYHTVVEAVGGAIKENPVHDDASHGSDALRTFAEAHQRGMLDDVSTTARQTRKGPVKVLTGLREVLPRPSPAQVRVLR